MSVSEAVGEPQAPTRREWLALAVLSVGLGLIVLDGTIVGVALPDIIADLGLDLTDAQWVNSLYAVILAALLLSTGSLADRWGRKRLLIAGVVVFVLGSALAAAAGSAGMLIGARAVQAVGAALIMPSTLSTVNAVFRGRYRAAAFGVWGAVISGAAAVGPLAGGALTQWASWHWIFLVNIPLGALVLIAAVILVPETRGRRRLRGMDVDGALLSAIGFGSLVFAIIEGPDLGWWTPTSELVIFGVTWPTDAAISAVPVAFAVSAVALVLFVVWERHREKVRRAALLDLNLFTLRTFSWGNVTAAMVAVGEFAIIFVLPLYLINALGLDVMGAGLVLAAMALGAFFAGASARHLAARVGSPGTVLIGLGLEVAGVMALAFLITATTPGWLVALPLVVYGLGLGLASAQLTGTVLRDVPLDISGQGSATQSTVRQIGSALGTAFAGAALSVSLAATLPAALAASGISGDTADQLANQTRQSAGTTIEQLRLQGESSVLGDQTATAVEALARGFADGARWSLLVASAFLVLGFVGAARLRRVAERRPPATPTDAAEAAGTRTGPARRGRPG
ncbi:DHA2 family efflux MFS transporter permease subunit [Microbacterium sp. LRZ72]|uniref:DHA2 family efflux MFS transporter permease subunit n=1 Tax=Microbacterium sp. LRZ72 TaxID=2942481 RepID=UPI0029B310EA|nr:DHA2 family efflux MFS transporter permease subunit [Microbacterium sp. LRZ72]MDX2376169.1 DHA2 family efflux MFS transporter permease subunit [Microbacterium sp. LRZ72]